jgi:3-hydroxyacyl-CoA dehydrogenase/enoyl-CoA hydratase/3-hydroxybutyryl-CoA epimerase
MGAGIAAAFLQKGHRVSLQDSSEEALQKGRTHVESVIRGRRHLTDEAKKKLLSALSASRELAGVPDDALVVEAVVENPEVKSTVFNAVEKQLGPKAILASNTSSLSLTELAEKLTAPQRFIGMHFFNPAEKMPLVEIVRARKTDDHTTACVAALTAALGKSPIIVEDVPGFLVNRILTPYLAEAGILLSQGVPLKTIDNEAKKFGMPMGPLRLLDEVGLDVAAKVAAVMEQGYGERMSGPAYAEKLVSLQRLGRKNGKGFYRYEDGKEVYDPEIRGLLGLPGMAESFVQDGDTQDRLILPMLNEAVRCLDEGVAGLPGPDAAAQIDLGSVMGTGFAPFRGGIIHYAEKLGAAQVSARLQELGQRYGKRFLPSPGIIRRAEAGISFYEAM